MDMRVNFVNDAPLCSYKNFEIHIIKSFKICTKGYISFTRHHETRQLTTLKSSLLKQEVHDNINDNPDKIS